MQRYRGLTVNTQHDRGFTHVLPGSTSGWQCDPCPRLLWQFTHASAELLQLRNITEDLRQLGNMTEDLLLW